MKPLRYHPIALKELKYTLRYYRSINRQLSADFKAELDRILDLVRLYPEMFAADDGGDARIAILRRFPYLVIYENLADEIFIIAISHQNRRPGYWKRRKPG